MSTDPFSWPKPKNSLQGKHDFEVQWRDQAIVIQNIVKKLNGLGGTPTSAGSGSSAPPLVLPLDWHNGGTGLSNLGSADQVLGVTHDGSALEFKSILGTANQISATGASGSITLALVTPLLVIYGGTGLTSAPTLGQALYGNNASGYTLNQPAVTSPVTVAFDSTSGKPTFGVNADTANTANYLVQRDGSGNFAAGAITASSIALTSGSISNTPASANDIANKSYVDSLAAGFDPKASCRVATTAALTATYSNGSSGVGATLTNSGTQAAITIDGIALSSGNRVLVKDQATASQNGIYTVTTVGSGSTNWVLTRATDCNSSTNIVSGMFTFVYDGTTNISTGWVMTTDSAITVGTTSLTWTQFTGLGDVVAGTGLSKSSNTISIANTAVTAGFYTNSSITVNAQGQLTSASSGTAPVTSVSAGAGIAVSGTTTPTVRAKRPLSITFMADYTPTATGGDKCEVIVPYSPTDGTTSLTYNLRRLQAHLGTTSSSGSVTMKLEKSNANSSTAFGSGTVTNMQTGGDLSIAASSYDGSNTTWSTSTVSSGDKLRINVTGLGTGTADWTVYLILEES